MRISFAIIGLSALCFASATTVEPVDAGYETPDDQGTEEPEAPWAPNGSYDGSRRDRAAYLARMQNDDDVHEVVAQEPRTPERQGTAELEAPWAPNGSYDGSLRDRAAYLARMGRGSAGRRLHRTTHVSSRRGNLQPRSLFGSAGALRGSVIAPAELVEFAPTTTTTVSPSQDRQNGENGRAHKRRRHF